LNEPPRLAQLLLERLAPPNEALLGDVAEAFREHQSAVWYWCQTVWITVSGVVAEVGHDPLLGARAVLTGVGLHGILVWAFWKIWFRTLSQPAFDFAQSTWGQSVLNEPYRLITATFWVGPGILFGWLLTRLFRQQRGMAVILHAGWAIAWAVPGSLSLIAGAQRPEVLFNLQLHAIETVIWVFAPVIGALLDSPTRSVDHELIGASR
jgi:hypothetical protein